MSGGQTWREVELSKSVSVKGGYGGIQPQCLSTKEIYVKGKKVLLVKVRKTDHWLQKVTQGKNCRRNCLARTQLLERIREELVEHKEHDFAAAVAAADEAAERMAAAEAAPICDEVDPMQALRPVAKAAPKPEAKKKPAPKKQSMEERLVVLELPKAYNAPGKTEVRVLGLTPDQRGTTPIWIHEDDLPWLLRYLADEANEGGLPPIEAIDDPAVAEQSEASAETPPKMARRERCRWDYAGTWHATIQKGPNRNTPMKCAVRDLTAEKWARVAKLFPGVTFEDAGEEDLQEAARFYFEICLKEQEAAADELD